MSHQHTTHAFTQLAFLLFFFSLPLHCSIKHGSHAHEQQVRDLLERFFECFKFSFISLPFLRGIARSARPFKRAPASWVKTSDKEVRDHICKLAKKGLTPSQIGVWLRDSFGVPLVDTITGTKVVRILRMAGESFFSFLPLSANACART